MQSLIGKSTHSKQHLLHKSSPGIFLPPGTVVSSLCQSVSFNRLIFHVSSTEMITPIPILQERKLRPREAEKKKTSNHTASEWQRRALAPEVASGSLCYFASSLELALSLASMCVILLRSHNLWGLGGVPESAVLNVPLW